MRYGIQHADPAAPELETALQGGPFHIALRAAIAARGLPLQRVQHHLTRYGVRVGVTSLSYWQQGARRPQRPESLRAVRALEEILQLPEESLIRLLAKPEERIGGAERPARSYRSLVAASGVLERLLAELDVAPEGELQTIGHHECVRIGARRELLARDSHHIVRAHKDGVDRYVAVHYGDPGCAPERITVHALKNCRQDRMRRHEETGVVVAELLFDIGLKAGGTFMFRYSFEDGTAGPCSEYVRGYGSSGGQYALQIRFTEGALPLSCHRFAQHSAAAPRNGRQELPMSGPHHSVHLVEPRMRSGIVGIGWDWE